MRLDRPRAGVITLTKSRSFAFLMFIFFYLALKGGGGVTQGPGGRDFLELLPSHKEFGSLSKVNFLKNADIGKIAARFLFAGL